MKDLERLAEEITEMAAHINAATAYWLDLIAEFDRRGGWADTGCKSCAHWVAWKCSLAPNAARERVRVARRLEGLPLIREDWGTDDDGTVRLGGRLGAEEGALVVAALEAVRERMDAERWAEEETRVAPEALCAGNGHRGAEVTPLTTVPRCGERLDLALAVDAVACWSPPPPAPPAGEPAHASVPIAAW